MPGRIGRLRVEKFYANDGRLAATAKQGKTDPMALADRPLSKQAHPSRRSSKRPRHHASGSAFRTEGTPSGGGMPSRDHLNLRALSRKWP
jgi:hypothetical protein